MTLGNLFWIIFFGLIVYTMMKKGGGCCGGHGHGGHSHTGHGGRHVKPHPPTDHHAQKIVHDHKKDPVCGMDVTSASAGSEFHGKTYRFCSDQCRQLFDLNPNKYADS